MQHEICSCKKRPINLQTYNTVMIQKKEAKKIAVWTAEYFRNLTFSYNKFVFS